MKTALLATALVAFAGSAAMAADVTYSGTFSTTTTNWNSAPTLPQFDNTPAGPFAGFVLTGVTLTLTGNVEGAVRLESLDAAASILNYNLQATLNFTGPGGGAVVAIPTASGIFNATAFDGTIDFGGTSGITLTGLTGTDTQSASPFVFAPYEGSGNVNFNLNASGTSNGSGAGNLLQQFNTAAGAEYSVKYTYIIPTPSAAALLGLGGLVATRRRRAR